MSIFTPKRSTDLPRPIAKEELSLLARVVKEQELAIDRNFAIVTGSSVMWSILMMVTASHLLGTPIDFKDDNGVFVLFTL